MVRLEAHADWILDEIGVEIRGDGRVREVFPAAKEATEEDWHAEYLDLVLAVRTVDDIDAAMEHIRTRGADAASLRKLKAKPCKALRIALGEAFHLGGFAVF